MPSTRRRFLGIVATGSSILAGCTGGGGGADGSSPAESPTGSPSPEPTPAGTSSPPPTKTPSPTATPSPTGTATAARGSPGARERFPDYEWSTLDGIDPVATTAIEMRGFEFHPPVAALAPGTEVTIANEDSSGHTITVPKLGIDETVDGGAAASIAIERTGTFDYVCEFHPPGMVGRFVVTASTPTGTPTRTPTPTPAPTGTSTPTPTPTEDDDGGGGY